MRAETATGEAMNVRDSLLAIAHDICEREQGNLGSDPQEGRWKQWPAYPLERDIFAPALRLPIIRLSNALSRGDGFRVVEATFELPEEDLLLTVNEQLPDTLNDDPFARDFLEKFNSFYGHPHEVCLNALRARSGHPEHKLVELRSAISGEILWS